MSLIPDTSDGKTVWRTKYVRIEQIKNAFQDGILSKETHKFIINDKAGDFELVDVRTNEVLFSAEFWDALECFCYFIDIPCEVVRDED